MRVFIDRGKKPHKEGKNAHVVISVFTHITVLSVFTYITVLSVFTHITTEIYQQDGLWDSSCLGNVLARIIMQDLYVLNLNILLQQSLLALEYLQTTYVYAIPPV